MAASAAYLPLDLAKMPCDDLDDYSIQQPRPHAQKETDELMKQMLKGKIYAARQSAPSSVSRSHSRDGK